MTTRLPDIGGSTGWRRAAAVGRGLLIATPLVVVGALFMSGITEVDLMLRVAASRVGGRNASIKLGGL